MTLGKSLLVHSAADPRATALNEATAGWGCRSSTCSSLHELLGRLQRGDSDIVLVEPSAPLRRLIADEALEQKLGMSLAEVEKQHIQRVLASTGGNKTKAARILGIDTKTLYYKLKGYASAEVTARRRQGAAASTPRS